MKVRLLLCRVGRRSGAMSLLRPHPVLVAVVDLLLDLYARSPQLQCRMMRSFHPEQGLASDSPLSILYLLLNRSRRRLWVLLLYLLRNCRALEWWFRCSAVPVPVPVPVAVPVPVPVAVPVPVPVAVPVLIPDPVPTPITTPTPLRRPVVATEPIRELPVTCMGRVIVHSK